MRAATVRDHQIVIAEHPDPRPGHGEALVRVLAAGLNGADQHRLHDTAPGAGIPGLEVAGEVAETGPGATRFAVGDRVMAVVAGGGQAELIAVHERQLMPVPDSMSWGEAGGFPEAFMTAWDALFSQGDLRAGHRLLVHGAAGGVGTAAVQLGAATGATVTATCRHADQHAGLAALGANLVIDPEDFAAHGPFDVILELVGAPNLAANLGALATSGRIVVIGTGAGKTAEIDLSVLMRCRGSISASMLRSRPLEEKALLSRKLEQHVLPLAEAGRIRVPVSATHPLADAAAAYAQFQAGGKLGKIVLTMA